MPEPILLGEHDLRGLSVTRLIRVKARILAKYLIEAMRSPLTRSKRLKKIRAMRGASRDLDALVLGLGPSARRVDPARVEYLQSEKSLEVFSVNAFALSQLAETVTPDHYVLTDPAYFGGDQSHYRATSRADPSRVWEYLEAHSSISIFIPHDRDAPDSISPDRVFFINTLGLQGFTKNISPTRPRGYLAITAYAALSVAGWRGYRRIYIAGIDNSQYQSLRLSERRRVSLGAAHLYTQDDGVANEVEIFRSSGVAGFFEDVSRLFSDLWLFAGLPIENLDARSLVDAFPLAPAANGLTRLPGRD